MWLLVTAPAGAVAKYCDEHICVRVCLSVCLSTRISPEPHARSLPIFLCILHVVVTRSILIRQGDEIPLGRESFGVFIPQWIDSALYSIAFGTHTKTAQTIEIPFGMMTWIGSRYRALDGGPDPQGEGAFGGTQRRIVK